MYSYEERLSNFDKARGIIGHECMNELIVDRLLTILGIPHLAYQLIHADVTVDGKTHEVYLCASEDFKAKSETKIALDAYKELEALPDESALEFCTRMGWEDYIYQMLVAAVGIVEKVISFLFLVPSSMLSTVSALGAQNIGAGKPERAIQTLRYAVMLAAGFGVLASIAIQFTAEGIVSLFTDPSTADGAAVVRFGGQYLRGYIFDCIFAGIHFSFSGFFCACRKSGLSFLHNILAIVLMRVPGVYVTSKLFPATLLPMGLATAAGSLLSVVICIIAFGVIRRKSTLVLVEE